jgi:hypothetical protein
MDHQIHELMRDVRQLKWYATGTTLLLLVGVQAAFHQAGDTRFTEIDVERLNVVESDGRRRLAISNRGRLSPPMFYGKEYPGIRGGNAPGIAGMIYFNDEGTEMGGFGWSGRETEHGGHRAVGLLTFDQYNQNEAIGLGYVDQKGRRSAGLTVLDQPNVSIQPVAESLLVIQNLQDGPEKTQRLKQLRENLERRGEVGARRLYLARDRDKAAIVSLSDPKGRERLRISVDSLGAPSVEFLDENGNVTHELPRDMR